jgi:RNA polymerase sigma-70 factor (ECF subfamily)
LLRLTYWESKTYEEAAALLSWPIGTVRSRLSRVRERLPGSLSRRGLSRVLGRTASAVVVQEVEAAAVQPPGALIMHTVRAATQFARVGTMTAAVDAGMVPATVAALVNGELATMSAISWKSIAVLLVLGGTVTAGVATLAARGTDEKAGKPVALAPQAQEQKKETSKSLLANGGVEDADGESPKAWVTGAEIPGVQYIWGRVGHAGKASLCLKKTAQRYFPIAQWYQEVDHKGDSPRLKVSAWIKAQKAGKAILDVQFIDGNGGTTHAWAAYIGAKEANDPPATHDWKRYEGVVAIPPGTKQLIIAPQIYGPGTVWFDDLDAVYTTDPATDPTKP